MPSFFPYIIDNLLYFRNFSILDEHLKIYEHVTVKLSLTGIAFQTYFVDIWKIEGGDLN